MAKIHKEKIRGFVIEYQQNGQFVLDKAYEEDPLPEASEHRMFIPVNVPIWDVFWEEDRMGLFEHIGSELEGQLR